MLREGEPASQELVWSFHIGSVIPNPPVTSRPQGVWLPGPPSSCVPSAWNPRQFSPDPLPSDTPFALLPSPPHLKRTPYPVGRFSSRRFSCLTGIRSLCLICVSGDEAWEEGAVTVPLPLWPLASEPGRAGAWPPGALPVTLCHAGGWPGLLSCTHHAVRLPTACLFPGAQNAVHCSLQMLS